MSITHEVQPDLQRVITRVVGELSLQALKTEQAPLWVQPELLGFSELFDLRKARFSEMFLTEAIQYAAIASTHVRHSRIALRVSTDSQQQVARIYATARSFRENRVACEIFHDEAQALDWLSVA